LHELLTQLEVYKQWKENGITAVKAMELSGLSKATFYRKVKEYEAKRKQG